MDELGISALHAKTICEDKDFAMYFENIIQHTKDYKAAANWMLGPIKQYLNMTHTNIIHFDVVPAVIAQLLTLLLINRLVILMLLQNFLMPF